MSVLLIDFESTGIDTSKDRITEVGAMIVDDSFVHVHSTMSQLVWSDAYPALTPEVSKITGITYDMLDKEAVAPGNAMKILSALCDGHDITHVVAYNRAYDENLFKAEAQRDGSAFAAKLVATPWVCAMSDVEKHYDFKSWKLMHVALDHGLTVNPKELHRAIADVELMRKVLVANGQTIGELHAFQQMPWAYVRAIVRKPWEDDGKSSGDAKALGYTWEQCKGDETKRKFEKCWVKRVKQKHVQREMEIAPFRVTLIGG